MYDKALEYQKAAHKLDAFPTAELVNELEKRIGVTSIFIEPYDSFELKKQMLGIKGEDPEAILIISD